MSSQLTRGTPEYWGEIGFTKRFGSIPSVHFRFTLIPKEYSSSIVCANNDESIRFRSDLCKNKNTHISVYQVEILPAEILTRNTSIDNTTSQILGWNDE